MNGNPVHQTLFMFFNFPIFNWFSFHTGTPAHLICSFAEVPNKYPRKINKLLSLNEHVKLMLPRRARWLLKKGSDRNGKNAIPMCIRALETGAMIGNELI